MGAYDSYQSKIQGACRFSDPAKVWAAIETHDNPHGVYDKISKGLGSAGSVTSNHIKDDKTIPPEVFESYIQSCCNFENSKKVFDCLKNNHKYYHDLVRVLALALANKR